ncbi:MAG TPA: hydantoinase B/oxoprolinase family protein, partial [Acetobacteraceae bacterium]|nr:hydantoinase B/oxoprolinase family protein [Acetobacteraceae bacterium]
ASAHGDGKSGLLFPTSAANTPVELLESRMPVLVEEKALVPDSGGPGRLRGGLGQVLRVRRLEAGEPILVGLFPEGWGTRPEGLFGGWPGGEAQGFVIEADGARRDVGAGAMVSLADPGLRIEVWLAGGAGYGDPRERAAEFLRADLADGYVTPQGAARDYAFSPAASSAAPAA